MLPCKPGGTFSISSRRCKRRRGRRVRERAGTRARVGYDDANRSERGTMFIDKVRINVKGGDGGAGACRFVARLTCPKAVPTAATAATAATWSSWPTRASRPHRVPLQASLQGRARHARARFAHARCPGRRSRAEGSRRDGHPRVLRGDEGARGSLSPT